MHAPEGTHTHTHPLTIFNPFIETALLFKWQQSTSQVKAQLDLTLQLIEKFIHSFIGRGEISFNIQKQIKVRWRGKKINPAKKLDSWHLKKLKVVAFIFNVSMSTY